MENSTTFFNNKFDESRITNLRILNFANNTLRKMALRNSGGQFTLVINALTPAIAALQDEVNAVDSSLNRQKGSTQTTTGVLDDFKKAMSDEEPFIARAVGGKGSEAYLEFYPNKVSEYSQVTKEQMTTLTTRVMNAAKTYETPLGTVLFDKLISFKPDWTLADTVHETQINEVDASRDVRSTKRTTVELLLMQALGTAIITFPGDQEKCKELFDFTLLHSDYHQKVFEVAMTPGGIATVLEHRFGAKSQIKVMAETATNLRLFLSTTADEAQGAGQEIAASTEEIFQISAFNADVKTHHFIVVRNLDAVAPAKVRVELL